MAGPPSGSRTGGVLVTGLEGTDQRRFQRQLTVLKGYAALAADRRGNAPSACGRRTCRSGKGRRPWPQSGTAGRRRRRTNTAPWWPATTGSAPCRGALPLWRRAWHAGLGGPWGRSCWTMSRRSGGRRGDLAEKAEPFQTLPSWTDRETGELLRALLRALCEDLAGAGAPRDKGGGAEWRSEPSSWNT